MPHIDEGTLHALLDGALRVMEPEQADAVEAHLEACAECRARAEEAATLRGRTDEILGVLEPAVAPDFDEVLVRAGASGSGGGAPAGTDLRRQLHWTRSLAWAATLVIALGTGYLIRDLVPPPGAATADIRAAEEGELMVGDDSPSTGGQAAGSGVMEDGAAESAAERGATASGATAGGAVEREPTQGGAAERAATEGRAAEREAMASTERESPPRSQVQTPITDGRQRMAAQVEESAPADRTTEAPAPGAPAATVPGLESVAPEDVLERMGAPLMVLPGAEVMATQVNQGPGGRLVVSTQRLQEGLEIRVTQQPAAIALESIVVTGMAEADARPPARSAARDSMETESLPLGRPAPRALRLAPAADAESSNRVTVPGAWLGWEMVLEGPLPPEALEALGAAARPYEPDAR